MVYSSDGSAADDREGKNRSRPRWLSTMRFVTLSAVVYLTGLLATLSLWGSVFYVAPAIGFLGMIWGLPRTRNSAISTFIVGAFAGAGVTTSLTCCFAVAWMFDIAGTATGSSTAAIALIFIPVLAFVVGLCVWLVVSLIAIPVLYWYRKKSHAK
jgi:hypothetical protein